MKKLYDCLCYVLTFLMLFSILISTVSLLITFALPILMTYNFTKLILLIINLVLVLYIMLKFYNFSTHRLF